jgi:hypothetical protein
LKETLRGLAERIERLAHPSDDGRFSWSRLWGRLTRIPRRPKIETAIVTRLVDRMEFGYAASLHPRRGSRADREFVAASLRSQAEGIEPAAELYDLALRELAGNIARAEQTSFVHGRLPDGHLDRLWRLYQVAFRALEWVADPEGRPLLRELIFADARCALSPLTTASSHGDPRPIHGVDALIAAANAETRSIGRQRRLLEAARQQLLDASAAVRLDPTAERARSILLARRIARLDRLQAAGVAPNIDLGYQVREAAERGEMERLCAALSGLEESAFAAGDIALQRLASHASASLAGGAHNRLAHATRAGSLRVSENQLFGAGLRTSIGRAYAAALQQLEEVRAGRSGDPEQALIFTNEFLGQWEQYLTVGATDELLAAAAATTGCFQVGASSSPGQTAGGASRPEVVSFPQQEMVLEPIGGVEDMPSAVIGDPRSVLLDLAAGKLLARRYVGWRPQQSGERRMRNEVRVYVVDGSSSMLGPRARMRDALLLSELSSLGARLQDAGRSGDQVLYYRYFNDKVGETRRVATAEEAALAVDDIIGNLRYGGTDIQAALLASFEQIRLAVVDDPDLARAQIVLVTDGEAPIDENALRRAREGVGGIPVGVSIIALGTQNPELRQLAARQRARGERVFYQFVDDEELRRIVEGETAGLPLHVPPGEGKLTAELRSVLADIDRHLRRIDADEVGSGADIAAGLGEVGLSPETALDRRTRARIAAIENDRVSLHAAFVRAFPPAAPPDHEAAEVAAPALPADAPHLAEVVSSLATVAEIVENYGAGAVERQADAVEILERLLAEANVPPWSYAELVKRPPEAVKGALRAVHAAARFSAGG